MTIPKTKNKPAPISANIFSMLRDDGLVVDISIFHLPILYLLCLRKIKGGLLSLHNKV
jgi:hypothetical protein